MAGIAMPEEWGVDPAVLARLLGAGAGRLDGGADGELATAIADLRSTPLFASEVEPEVAESFQLDALSAWLTFADVLGAMGEEDTERIVRLARELAVYLDDVMEASLIVVPGDGARARYLAEVGDGPRAYGLGYFGTRNLEVEAACHEAIASAGPEAEALDPAAVRRCMAVCDGFSSELTSALRAFAET
ncbi:hypothetical protein [Actinacidiphila rubida]|uniref:hypothetical protein n=1 Tax=Actinacidiphila rubida TaxID=310780 RepID=UPI00114CE2CB|nr:hypothetical protein [Actinacidiphila rubida]